MDGIEAVCFDLDGTLCVSDQPGHEIHRAVFDRVGAEPFFEPADLYAVDTVALPDPDSEREHFEQLYRAVGDRVGADPDPATLSALAEATLEVLDPTAVSFRDGARAALDDAAERYAVGLLTNGTAETQRAKLESLGIGDAFDAAVFCGPGTGLASKPDPEPFRTLLADLDVAPDAAVYVGDNLAGDVAGALNAGMATAWVPIGDAPADPEPAPDYRLNSPADLRSVL